MDDYPQPQSGYPDAMENDPVEAINKMAHVDEPDFMNRKMGEQLLRRGMAGRKNYIPEETALYSFSTDMGRQ